MYKYHRSPLKAGSRLFFIATLRQILGANIPTFKDLRVDMVKVKEELEKMGYIFFIMNSAPHNRMGICVDEKDWDFVAVERVIKEKCLYVDPLGQRIFDTALLWIYEIVRIFLSYGLVIAIVRYFQS